MARLGTIMTLHLAWNRITKEMTITELLMLTNKRHLINSLISKL